jgi:c-di-AMP phosphodiesterase-like protein
MRYFVLLVLVVIVMVWLIQRAHNDKEADKGAKKETLKEDIEQTTDYLTGRTQINVMFKAKRDRRKWEIQSAVRYFEGMEGRRPRNLEELLEKGYIIQEQMYDEFGKGKYKLISGQTPEGRLFIKGMGRDHKEGTSDDWHAEF